MARTPYLFAAVLVLLLAELQQSCWGASTPYYGKLIGKLSQLHHGVSGEVYAVDARTLFIKDFTYDGEAPAAFFLAGNSKSVGQNGFQLRDERGSLNELKRYRKKDITLSLPEGKTLANVKWFSVWCEEFKVNFGDVKIPRNFDYPRPQKLGALSGVHGVSSEPVVVVDAQTLLVPSFSYDGEAPDAKFWVGAGPNPSPQGIRVADENGKEIPLRRYDRKTIVLTLPGDLTVHQIGHFGVWCEAFTVDFGHVKIPENLSVPPSLKMLGISPQSKLNCEVLDDELAFEVRWAVAGESIVVQLVSKLEPNEYMSFGLSADPNRSIMVGGDIVVAWVDKQTINGYAVDYFLDAKSQCAGTRGSCPDVKIQQDTDSVRLLNAAMVNGYSIVTYQRPLAASDELDVSILTNGTQAIIWGIGPLNDKGEVGFHTKYLKTNRLFDFGRPPAWNCPLPEVHEQRHASEIGPQPQQTVQPQVQQQPQLQQLQQQPLPAQQHQQYLQEEHPLQDDQVLQQPRRQPPAQEPHRRQQQQSQQLQEEPAQPAQQQQSQPQQHHSRRPQQQQQQQHHQEVQQQEQPSSPPPRRGGGHRRNQHRHQTTQAPQTQVQQTQQVQQVQQQVQPQVQQQVEQQQHQQSDRDAYYLENTQRVAPTTRRPPRIQATPAPAPRTDAWEIPPIQCYEPEDGVFYAQMGPTGGKHGYPAITGHVGWGISWYINGLLIPEIHVVRGKQYTFVVEAGEDPNVPARYHPFYITDDPVGGYFHKTPEERANVSIFAGVRRSRGVIRETGIGRLCNWVHDPNTPEADEFSSFGAFQRTLTLICDPGEPGLVQWIPDENTPDTVYYQCYTHRYLGWKIHVHDTCDTSPQDAASEKHEVVVEPELQQQQQQQQYEPQNTDLEVEASLVASPSKVTPSPEFFKLHREYASKDYGDYLRNQAAANHHPSPHHHLHHPHMANAINNHGKLVTDQSINQLMRRPAASYLQLMSHQDRHLANSVHRVPAVVPLSSTSPVVVSTTTSKTNLIFNRAKMDNLKMEYVPQTPPAVQVMIVPRRSHNIALKQRPLLMVPPPPPVQQPQQPSSVIPVSKPPVFYERKKAVYKAPPLPVLPRLQKPPSLYVPAQPYYPTKLVKIDPKPHKIKVESKPKPQIDSFSSEHKANLLRPMMMKPARNTGFDPGSIVIEKGFKPILRKTLLEDSKSPLDRSSEVQAREEDKEPSKQSQQPNNFEPVFIPSFPDSPIKPTKKKLQKSKLKATDSELVTAAREGVDFAYVHIPSVVSRNPKSHSLNATASSPVSANTTTGPRQNNTIEAKTEPSSKRVKRFPQGPPPGESARDDTHHHHDDEHHHDHHEDHQHHQSTSTGQLILANIEYIVLTVVLYYVL